MDRSFAATQLSLLDDTFPTPVVNVASIPHRSPFRYPGGKTWLVPKVRQWLASMSQRPDLLIEPFAGGATIGLTVAFEQLAKRVILVEKDEDVAAVWETILNEKNGAQWLAQRILNFSLTPISVQTLLDKPAIEQQERAFQTIVQNRVNHGGILAPGAGVIKNGENGKGIRSRWYPQTLAKRILAIAANRERISFIEGDAFEVMASYANQRQAVFFIDPPYTASAKKAGRRLYKYHEIDHERLFALTASVAGDFLMTYDDAEEVRALAGAHNLDTRLAAMTNTHHATMNELLIGRKLNWIGNLALE